MTRSCDKVPYRRGVGFLLRLLGSAAGLAAAAWLLDGITFGGAEATTGDRLLTVLGVAVVFGLVNALVKPVVKLLALPFVVLTLGLLLFVINAAMLELTDWLTDRIAPDFDVAGFGTALVGALVITVVSWGFSVAVRDDD